MMSFETPSSADRDPRYRWAAQEQGALDRAARLGRRELPEATAFARACAAMTQRLHEEGYGS